MAWTPTEENVRGRIDDLEAIVNGLMIYIAAKEAGVTLDKNAPNVKKFLIDNVVRPRDARLQQSGAVAGDGYWDGLAAAKIPLLRDAIKRDFGT